MTDRYDMTRRYPYSPINRRPTGRWPGGERLAVYVAIGVEAYRFGEGQTEDLLPGVPAPDLVNTAWRDYGNRVGSFRLFDRLAECGVPPTVLLNTMVYDTAPAVTDAARAAGAEIVGHGVSNSDSLAAMDPAAERAYLTSVSTAIQTHEGERLGGWSSPWLTQTPTTVDSLAATGYRYLLDWRPDDQPMWLTSHAGPLLSIPYALELNDSTTVVGRQVTAADFADMIVDEFDDLLDSPDDHPIVMSVVLHSFISGVPFRLRPLTRALRHIAVGSDEVWLTQPRYIHRAFATLRPPDPAPAREQRHLGAVEGGVGGEEPF